MSYLVYRRQFLIARKRIALDDSWNCRFLRDGWILSWQGDLGLREHREADGRIILILGEAWCFDGLEAGGSGRYVTLDWPHVRSDRAGATLSLFHGGTGADTVVSSNAGLVAAVLRGLDVPPLPDDRTELRPRALQNYVPAPGSRYRDVRRLMRDQRIDLTTGLVERCSTPVRPMDSHARAVEVVADELTRFAREARERVSGRIHLQLTAGLDSRTILAAFLATGVPFAVVTLRSPAKPEEDITMAREICARLGLRHSVSDLTTPPDPGMEEVYGRQTSWGLDDWDKRSLFPGDIYRFLVAGDVMVGGLCFEVGRQKFGPVYAGLDLGTATGAELWRRLSRAPEVPEGLAAFLDEWLAWRRADPYPFNLAATHYLDQRLGAWAGTMMAGYDLIPGLTLHPANNPRIFDALVTPELGDQVEGRLQMDVIRRLAPELLAFPVNPVPLGRQVRQLLSRARRRVRQLLPT